MLLAGSKYSIEISHSNFVCHTVNCETKKVESRIFEVAPKAAERLNHEEYTFCADGRAENLLGNRDIFYFRPDCPMCP